MTSLARALLATFRSSHREFYAQATPADWQRIHAALKLPDESQVAGALNSLFEDGVPVNAANFVGDDATSIADMAWHMDIIEGMLFMLERLPGLIHQYENPLRHFSCFPEVVRKILEDESSWPYLSDPELFASVRQGVRAETIELLARAGMKFDVEGPIVPGQSGSGNSCTAPMALLIATERAADVLEVLASEGVDLAARDHLGNTLIHCVTKGVAGKGRKADARGDQVDNFSRKVQLALDAGVEVDAINYAGDTALHLAARHGFANKAKVLLECGASLQATTVDGKTAADLGRASRKPRLRSIMQVALAQAVVQAVLRNAGR